jgi:alanine-synthesizing transaminase
VFGKVLPSEAKVAVGPGVGLRRSGDGFVRLALVENEARIRQAVRGIRRVIGANPLVAIANAKE